jgi:glycosyltransferase involved in cell wall biosynthesis
MNGAHSIKRTIESLLRQSSVIDGSNSLRIIVRDGGSTDNIANVLSAFNDERIEFHSEPDRGMYDALTKGLRSADGDICCYLPAGEVYDHGAFSTVSEIFESMPEVQWLTGRQSVRNAKQQMIGTSLPHPYRRKFIDRGLYGTRLGVIQQESTFWRTHLNSLIDLHDLSNCRLAGDYFIWKSFAKMHELHVVDSIFAGFTIEEGQLSKIEPGAYKRELRALRTPPSLSDRLAALVIRQHEKRAEPRARARNMIKYDLNKKRWILS